MNIENYCPSRLFFRPSHFSGPQLTKPWRKKYGGISPSELKHMQQHEEESLRVKKLVADLSLDKAMLQDVLAKKN